MSFKHCPGVRDFVGPASIIIRTCPACGEEVEFFSDETEAECSKCGRTLHLEATQSCVSWCQYAEKCIDDLKYRGLISLSKAEELKRLVKKK
ncbi:MAG: hypothetical protein L6N95_05310 [Candidatus Methylarchaceae archaeon HK01B]|nr:hypothetical protein [Candidatus Methylarchaceae archaeon HK01M]MCP8319230.1 hypothetical protein [Candidatus Methylarchaceae archaeon HK01B]